MFFAHSTDRKDRSNWQMLPDHLMAVAGLAGERGSKFGARRAAALAGILHDLGKYSAAFQRRLDGSGEAVDHSTAGAKHVGRLVVDIHPVRRESWHSHRVPDARMTLNAHSSVNLQAIVFLREIQLIE